MGNRRLGLRSQLVGPLAILLVIVVGLSFWNGWTANEQMKANTAEELSTLVNTLTRPPSFPLTEAVLAKMKGLTGCEFLLVRSGGTTTLQPGSEADGFLFSPFEFPETHANFGSTLWVGYPTARWRERQWEAIRGPLILGVAVVLAILWLLWQSTQVVNRIHTVKAQAEALVNDAAIQPAREKNDELGDLQQALTETHNRLSSFQQQLKETERLRVLGQFSGGLAHQLRNAATAAKLSVQLSMHDSPPDAESLRVALRQLQRMESMLQQFLQVGKPTADSVLSQVNLEVVVQQAVEEYIAQAKHLGITLTVQTEPGQQIMGQPIGLAHLIGNLIGNALDAAGPGGAVAVKCIANVLEVSDSGTGPAPEIQSKLFEPFVTTKLQGIGLGLSVAQQVAVAHGSTIEWFRREGVTVFRVILSHGVPVSDPPRPR